MSDFYCKYCDYTATTKQNLEKHNKGIKHIKRCKEVNKYVCDFCGLICTSRNIRYYHMKRCEYRPEEDVPTKKSTVETPLKSPTEDNTNTDKLLGDAISTNKDMAKAVLTAVESSLANAKNTGKSMNMMKYAMVNFKDAPPLLSLDQTQVYQLLDYDQKHTDKPKDQINADYIMPVLRHYENKVLDEFFGEFIVNYFNTEEMKDRKFWTSDVSRLSFIIMQVVNREGEREWNHDKTGKKFIDLVIDPMFDEVVKLLDEFVNNKQKWIDENFGKVYIAPSKMTHLMTVQQLAKELQLDIKYHKFTKDILKYVAPHFNFDTMRLVEEAKQLEQNSRPKKVTKITKAKK